MTSGSFRSTNSASTSPTVTPDPSSWRQGLRKTDSSSAVPDRVTNIDDEAAAATEDTADEMSRSDGYNTAVAREASRIGSMMDALSRSASSGSVSKNGAGVKVGVLCCVWCVCCVVCGVCVWYLVMATPLPSLP